MSLFPELDADGYSNGSIGANALGGIGLGSGFGLGDKNMTNTYTVSGVVRKDNVPVQDYSVTIYKRSNGILLDRTISGVDGSFELTTVGFPGFVTVVANDKDNELNALIYDMVIPI